MHIIGVINVGMHCMAMLGVDVQGMAMHET
jgi:hypothetical protein